MMANVNYAYVFRVFCQNKLRRVWQSFCWMNCQFSYLNIYYTFVPCRGFLIAPTNLLLSTCVLCISFSLIFLFISVFPCSSPFPHSLPMFCICLCPSLPLCLLACLRPALPHVLFIDFPPLWLGHTNCVCEGRNCLGEQDAASFKG
jgi:hypothetical protein